MRSTAREASVQARPRSKCGQNVRNDFKFTGIIDKQVIFKIKFPLPVASFFIDHTRAVGISVVSVDKLVKLLSNNILSLSLLVYNFMHFSDCYWGMTDAKG